MTSASPLGNGPPLVSVIVPTHQRPRLLLRALRSILDQTLSDFEVVVVNDGGASVAEAVAELADVRIALIELPASKGASAARNAGLRAARSKYIAYLDDDDIYFPHHLQTLVQALEGSSQRVAYSDPRRANAVGEGEECVIIHRDRPYSHTYDQRLFLYRNFIPTLCIVHERSLLNEVGLFDESYPVAEDWDLWCKMALVTDFLHVPEVTCEYLSRSDQSGLSSGSALRFPTYEAQTRKKIGRPIDAQGLSLDSLRRERRAITRMRLGTAEDDIARWSLEVLCKADPSDSQLSCKLAVLLLLDGEAQRGMELLREVLSWSPDFSAARTLLGTALLLNDKPQEALATLHEDPSLASFHRAQILSGDCYLALGDLDRAEQLYKAVIQAKAGSIGDALARLSNVQVQRSLKKHAQPELAASGQLRSSSEEHASPAIGKLVTVDADSNAALRVVTRPNLPHRVVPVLGMHRSGTSMLTHMLQHLGLDLGAPLIKPAFDNPRGFWEHAHFIEVNQKLLAACKCNVDGFSPPGQLRQAARTMERFAQPALAGVRQLIAANFAGGAWGFKDPRTVITLPFWLAIFKLLGMDDVRPIVVLRSPSACARSLMRRGDVKKILPSSRNERKYVLQLWSSYNTLLEELVPEGALWLQQEDLIDPDRNQIALELCAEYLGLRTMQVQPALSSVAEELVHRGQTASESCGIKAIDTQYERLKERAALPARPARKRRPTPHNDNAKGSWCIFVARNTGGTFARPFEEVALALHYGMRRLGISAPIVTEPWQVQGTPIVLGAQLLPESVAARLPADSVIYNLEQVSRESKWFTPSYIRTMQQHRVWDYSRRNLASLRSMGIAHAELCEVGSEEELVSIEPLPEEQRDIDVLFYGAVNARRRAILDQLAKAGLQVTILSNVFGAARDAFIRRSKMVLNLHFYQAQILELVRLSYLMTNGVCVVSEPGSELALTQGLQEGVRFSDYERIAQACVDLAGDAPERARQSNAAREIFRKQTQHQYLLPLIERDQDSEMQPSKASSA